jgi:hypothetical protein
MDSQEGIDEVYILDYFDRTKIDGDINSQSKKTLTNAYLGRNQLTTFNNKLCLADSTILSCYLVSTDSTLSNVTE